MKKTTLAFALSAPPLLLYLLFTGTIKYIVAHTTNYSLVGEEIRTAIPYVLMVNHSILFLFLFLLIRNLHWQEIGANGKSKTRNIVSGLVVGALLFAIQQLITIPVLQHFQLFQPWNGFPGAAYLVSATVFAGIVEEFLYRGVGISVMLKNNMNRHMAVVLTTVCFAGLHYGEGIPGIINSAIMGTILGYLFLYRKNIWANATAHATANLLFILHSSFMR